MTNAGTQPYLDYFTLPGNERYYDFVFIEANAARLIASFVSADRSLVDELVLTKPGRTRARLKGLGTTPLFPETADLPSASGFCDP